MTTQELVSKFRAHQKRIKAYHHAQSSLYYDAVTVAPANSSSMRGDTLEILAEESYRLLTDGRLEELLNELALHKQELDTRTLREAEELTRELDHIRKMPMEEYAAYQVALNDAEAAWHAAKAANDYPAFAPHLETLLAFNKRMAGYINDKKPVYDVLLDDYERGLDCRQADAFFDLLRSELTPVIHAVCEKQYPAAPFASAAYPIWQQRKISDMLMDTLTIDRSCCAIGETEHPFTIEFNRKDVRITTHYHENQFTSNLFSVIHEGGHALYELNMGEELDGSVLASGTSMGVHESQSRFFENIIGRSLPFAKYLMPRLQQEFPTQLAGVTAEDLYREVCRSTPSLIRIEADELTYASHIMVRYRMERLLLEEGLPVAEAPAMWNKLYKEYLGVDVPDDTHGILQDSHWSGGMFGYFPSYAIGSAYAAQMLASMEKDLPVWQLVEQGDLAPIVQWLTQRIYRFGCLYTPDQVLMSACGAKFDPHYFVDYLKNKYTALYNL